jgi:hypothetical protein
VTVFTLLLNMHLPLSTFMIIKFFIVIWKLRLFFKERWNCKPWRFWNCSNSWKQELCIIYCLKFAKKRSWFKDWYLVTCLHFVLFMCSQISIWFCQCECFVNSNHSYKISTDFWDFFDWFADPAIQELRSLNKELVLFWIKLSCNMKWNIQFCMDESHWQHQR